jgi:Rhs element Vgr protein
MPVSPIHEETNLISFGIFSAGSEIPGTYEVVSIRTEQHLNRIASAEIILLDGSAANQTFQITDSNTFKPGVEIEIKLGYHSKNESVFKGIVVKQKIKVNTEGSKLHVICKDKSLRLTVNRNNNIFTDSTDSAAMESIINDAGLQCSITATSVSHKEIVQYYASDWDFILNRSEINGMVVSTDGGKVTITKPRVSDTPELQVHLGYDIIDFDGELDATYQYSDVQGNTWDMSTQSMLNASSSEPLVNNQGDLTGSQLANILGAGTSNLNTNATVAQEDIQEWANAAILKSRLSRFRGCITFQGSSKAKVNSTIKLMGLCSRFNGNAFISGVVHSIEDGTWITEVKLGLSPEWITEAHKVNGPQAAGLIPGVRGLQTGIVKKIDSDPDNEFRVKVELPVLGAEGKFMWARLSTFYASNNFGAYFMPEINDEVILGFMNDDPRFPIILGSVYSSSLPAPETPEEKNSIKTLVTQSKLQLKFDDENKVITVLTPGGNTMVFSDRDEGIKITDQNNNSIEMNSSGITIDSKSDLNLKAANAISINGTSISVEGSESISNTGGSVSITGHQSTSISGNAECTVSSSCQTSIKGAMININ